MMLFLFFVFIICLTLVTRFDNEKNRGTQRDRDCPEVSRSTGHQQLSSAVWVPHAAQPERNTPTHF